jgi:hypothetical protein
MNVDEILAKLDSWVSMCGNGKYYAEDAIDPLPDLQVMPVHGMQQVRREIQDLLHVMPGRLSTVLEIGLGHFGSTHVMWRNIADQVYTIEQNHNRVNEFSLRTEQVFGHSFGNDGRSHFAIGSSQDPATVKKIYDAVHQVDLLFIDGDHSYHSVLCDWLLYEPLVRPGGIVVFDDILYNTTDGGVPRFVGELANGRFGIPIECHKIVHSRSYGKGYYIKG